MFNLRYMQTEAIDAIRREWESHQGTACIMATGTGKTILYCSLGIEEAGRVLVLVHRDYLINQPVKKLKSIGFEDVGVEKAELRSEASYYRGKIVFASVQSISRPNRLETFDPQDFSVLIIDEAHRAVAATYRRVIDYFTRLNPRLRVLLLTATPKRKDNVALGELCGGDISVAYVYGPKTAADEGWLVPLRFYRRQVKDLDFSHVKMKGTDLDPAQLEALMTQESPLHEVCASLAEDRGATAVFCPTVKVAHAYAHLMNERYRPGRSVVLWEETPEAERVRAGKMLAQGEIDYLFNVDIVTEGYDVPELQRVVWAAPTASLVKFTQGTGRVFRPHSSLSDILDGGRDRSDERRLLIAQSPKPVGHVVTYYPQNCRHQLCEPNDILGGDELPQEIRKTAKQIQEATAAQASGSDPDEDVETAKAFVQLRALLDTKRREIKARATYDDTEYDGFGGSRNRKTAKSGDEKKAAKAISEDWPGGDAASDKQIGWLKYHGIPNARELGLTKWRAVCVRDLMEKAKFSPESALACSKKQALAVLSKFKVQS